MNNVCLRVFDSAVDLSGIGQNDGRRTIILSNSGFICSVEEYQIVQYSFRCGVQHKAAKRQDMAGNGAVRCFHICDVGSLKYCFREEMASINSTLMFFK